MAVRGICQCAANAANAAPCLARPPTNVGRRARVAGRRHRDLHLLLVRVAQAPVQEPEGLWHVAQVGALAVQQEPQRQLLQQVLPLLRGAMQAGGQAGSEQGSSTSSSDCQALHGVIGGAVVAWWWWAWCYCKPAVQGCDRTW